MTMNELPESTVEDMPRKAWRVAVANHDAALAAWQADPEGTDATMIALGDAEETLITTPATNAAALAFKVEVALGDGRIVPPLWRRAIIADLDRLAA